MPSPSLDYKVSFSSLRQDGYQGIHPIIPPGVKISERSSISEKQLGKIPGYLNGDGGWHSFAWQTHQPSDHDIERWDQMDPRPGIGFKGSDTPAIDIDVLDTNLAEKIRLLALGVCGDSPTRTGQAPKCLLPYRCSAGETIPSRMLFQFTLPGFPTSADGKETVHKVEIIGDKKQWVGFGVHPKTRLPYSWDRGLPHRDQLRTLTNSKLDTFTNSLLGLLIQNFAEIKGYDQGHSSSGLVNPPEQSGLVAPSIAILRDIVRNTPNTGEGGWDEYLRFGAAIKAAAGDDEPEGQDIFLEWCSRWQAGHYSEDISSRDWDGLKPPFRVGFNFLVDHSARLGNHTALRHLVPLDFERLPPEPGSTGNTRLSDIRDNEAIRVEEGPKTPDFPCILYEEVGLIKPKPYLVKGFMACGEHYEWYGPPKSGKTFSVIDFGFHISSGLPWAGRKVKQGGFLHCAAEDGQGVLMRVRALQIVHGFESLPFMVIPFQINLFESEKHAIKLIESIKRFEDRFSQPVRLTAIDTLAKAMAGGDENTAKDMGLYVHNVDRIKDETGTAIISIHHSGKDIGKGGRGSNALLAGVDGVVEVNDGMLTPMFMRNFALAPPVYVELKPVVVGVDEDGDDVTTCVAVASATPRVNAAKDFSDQDIIEQMKPVFLEGLARATGAQLALSHTNRGRGVYAPKWIAALNLSPLASEKNLAAVMETMIASGELLPAMPLPWKRDNTRHFAEGLKQAKTTEKETCDTMTQRENDSETFDSFFE